MLSCIKKPIKVLKKDKCEITGFRAGKNEVKVLGGGKYEFKDQMVVYTGFVGIGA